MLENHNFIEARYIDDGHKNVATIWENENGEQIQEIVQADPTQIQWKQLMKFTTVKKIEKTTVDWKRHQSAMFNEFVKSHAYALLEDEKEKHDVEREKFKKEIQRNMSLMKDMQADFLKAILDKNIDNDMVFKFKLAIFEMEEMKKAKPVIKRKLRKCKTLLNCLGVFNEII